MDGWTKNTRDERKNRVVAEVRELLEDGDCFASRPHDLQAWASATKRDRRDMADAIAQCLCYHYRNLGAVRECVVAPPAPAEGPPSSSQRNRVLPPAAAAAGAGSSRQRSTQPLTKATVKGKLQLTLSKLGITHGQIIRRESGAARKLFKVWQQHPNDAHLLQFLKDLDHFNQKGKEITNEDELQKRLTPLLT